MVTVWACKRTNGGNSALVGPDWHGILPYAPDAVVEVRSLTNSC